MPPKLGLGWDILTLTMALLDDLRQILRDKPSSVVLIIGTGVPVGALRGAPCSHLTTWEGLLRSGLQRVHELQKISAEELAHYDGILTHGNLKAWLMVAGRIEDELGAPAHGEFRRWLRETVGTFEKHVTDGSVLEGLAAHQRRGALLATTNYDLLLEDATDLHAVTWRDPAGVERALRGDEPQILHLHGAWRWPDSIVLGVKSYTDVARDAHAQSVLTTLRTDRTFVFVGCGAGLRDPNLGAFLRWTADVFKGSEYRHFRLCLDAEVPALKLEHPDEQRIFPLPYGATHAELAPFLRSLLPPGASDAPTQAPARVSPRPPNRAVIASPTPAPTPPAPVMTQPPPTAIPERWDLALEQFFASAFPANSELFQLFVHALPREMADALPGTDIAHTLFAFRAVELLKAHGACDHSFFEALRNTRPHRRPELDAIQLACLGTLAPPSPPPQLPSTLSPTAAVSLARFALVLDRSDQWHKFTIALRGYPRHVLAVVHGDDRQDVKLFVARTLQWANSEILGLSDRNHEIIPIQSYQGNSCPRVKNGWITRIAQAIGEKRIDHGELPTMLRALAERSAALLVFIGANNGGLREGPGGMTLSESGSFSAALAALVQALPTDAAHAIRILVPVEHAADASANDSLLEATRNAAVQHPALDYLLLQELDFPTWKEVLPSLRDECARRGTPCADAMLERTFRPTYAEHEARKNTPTHSFAALGQALGELLDHHIPETAQ